MIGVAHRVGVVVELGFISEVHLCTCSQYRTPNDGYYQRGCGTHPGGCVIGSPWELASQRVLRDLNASRSGGVSAP